PPKLDLKVFPELKKSDEAPPNQLEKVLPELKNDEDVEKAPPDPESHRNPHPKVESARTAAAIAKPTSARAVDRTSVRRLSETCFMGFSLKVHVVLPFVGVGRTTCDTFLELLLAEDYSNDSSSQCRGDTIFGPRHWQRGRLAFAHLQAHLDLIPGYF